MLALALEINTTAAWYLFASLPCNMFVIADKLDPFLVLASLNSLNLSDSLGPTLSSVSFQKNINTDYCNVALWGVFSVRFQIIYRY